MRRAILLLVLIAMSLPVAHAQPARAQTGPPAPERAVTCRDIDLTRPMTGEELRDAQMCQELQKLREEVTSLQVANSATRSGLGFLLPWSGIVGGLAAALAALLVPTIGILVRNSFEKSQRQKLEQERSLQREQHNLKLMEGLGSANRAVQLASISSLLRRIDELKRRSTRADETEIKTLSDVVVSVLRDPQIDEGVSKYLADEIVNVFDLRIVDQSQRGSGGVLSLREFNLSRARLKDVYWADVYASGVDLYQADLSGASLRGADLSKAILYETNMQDAVLRGANLRGANLKRINLRGADLSGADLTDATYLEASSLDERTTWSAQTKWPAGFAAPAMRSATA